MYTTSITVVPSKEEGPSSLGGHRNNTKVINEQLKRSNSFTMMINIKNNSELQKQSNNALLCAMSLYMENRVPL